MFALAYGICNQSVIPCRAEPSDRAEMTTQLLFGEHFAVLRKQGNWHFIRNAYDNYESWIDIKQYQEISEETYEELQILKPTLSLELLATIEDIANRTFIPVPMCCTLPYFNGSICNLEGFEYHFEGHTNTIQHNSLTDTLIESAYYYLNAPYLWGGRSPLGIDCSGLIQNCFKIIDIKLPRDAYQQAECGETIAFVEESKPGDLAFFDNDEERIIHVGILLKNKEIIHASGKVRIDTIDHQGIFNKDTGKYSHRLRLIKRLI